MSCERARPPSPDHYRRVVVHEHERILVHGIGHRRAGEGISLLHVECEHRSVADDSLNRPRLQHLHACLDVIVHDAGGLLRRLPNPLLEQGILGLDAESA